MDIQIDMIQLTGTVRYIRGLICVNRNRRVHIEPSYDIHNARTGKERTYILTIDISYNLH
jgi:hypothetical protein